MLDDTLLTNFMNNFYGYGNLTAKYWFVGMEEAGGKSQWEIAQRITRWQELGSRIVVDNYEFHRSVDDPKGKSLASLFEGQPSLQGTWRGLIRIYLAAIGRVANSPEDVRKLQANDWGRSNSNNCLLELFPLPSTGTRFWHYHDWSEIEYLTNRETYYDALVPSRISKLREKILRYRPRCVIFYSMSSDYIKWWSEIANANLFEGETIQLGMSRRGRLYEAIFHEQDDILFSVTYHSTYQGLTNSYFEKLGEELKVRAAYRLAG